MNIAVIYLGWGVVALAMFRFCRPAVAVLGSFLGGWILLPVGAYPPAPAETGFAYWIIGLALPSDLTLTKAWVAPASALLGVVVCDRAALRRLRPAWLDVPIVLWCLWPVAASAFALSPRPTAAVSSAYLAGCWGLPWLLGRLYFARPDGQRLLVKGLVISALACLPFSIVEGALGVKVYELVYGPHPFRLDARYVGVKPLGFFENGNQFGLWIALCALAGIWLAVASPPQGRRRWGAIAAVLVAMSLAAQSVGAILLLVLGAIALSACNLVRPRRFIVAATALLVVGGATYVSGVVPFTHLARDTSVGREVVAGFRAVGRGSLPWRILQDQKVLGAAVSHPAVGASQWDWWRAQGTRPWGLSMLVIGQFGLIALVLVLATMLGPALAVAWSAPVATVWRPEGVPLLLAAMTLLAVVDALLNSFIFFPAILAAGGLAARGDPVARPPERRASASPRSSPA